MAQRLRPFEMAGRTGSARGGQPPGCGGGESVVGSRSGPSYRHRKAVAWGHGRALADAWSKPGSRSSTSTTAPEVIFSPPPREQRGERYVLNSFSMALSEVVRMIEEVTGRDVGVRYLPPLACAGWRERSAEGCFVCSGKDAPICAESVRTLLHGHVYDGSRRRLASSVSSTPRLTSPSAACCEWARQEGKL